MVVIWREQHSVWMKLAVSTQLIDMSIANAPSTSFEPIKFKRPRRPVACLQGYLYIRNARLFQRYSINPLNPKVKIKILIYRPYSFTVEVVGRS